MSSLTTFRHTARLALFDEHNRILMIKIEDTTVYDPKQPKRKAFWVTPGGKIEEGETCEIAAKRELFEETGIKESEVAFHHCVWKGKVLLNWKNIPTQLIENFIYVRVKKEAFTREHFTAEENAVIKEQKWFTLSELENSTEIFIPRDIATLVREIVEGKPPKEKEIDLSTPLM